MKLLLAFAGFVLALALTVPARAEIERFGIFIGNDRGDMHDGPLRYATSDAVRLRDVLVDLGGFSPGSVVVLRDADADVARRALIELNDRVRAATARPGTDVVLFVYYSGHADAQALHLGASRFDLSELEQLVRGSAAQFRVLLLDACRSGALTQTKGGTLAPPFPPSTGERLAGQGVAFLTSNLATEDAQESDDIRGSFFTHHFASGLLGAADADGDDRVTLDEAYRYAYDATLRATSRTWSGTQHPTFRYEIGGQGRIALTEPKRRGPHASLLFPSERNYVVFRDSPDGSVVGEVAAFASNRRLQVKPGRYFVRGRAHDVLLEGSVLAADGQSVDVKDASMSRTEYARLVRKGVTPESPNVHGPLAGYTMRSAFSNGTGVCQGAFVGYSFVFSALSITPRLDTCFSSFEMAQLRANVNEYSGDVRVAHVWDFPLVSVDLGLSVGASWLRQSFATSGSAPSRDTLGARTSIGPAVTFDLAKGFFLTAEVAAETALFRLEKENRSTSIAASAAVRMRAGLGKSW